MFSWLRSLHFWGFRASIFIFKIRKLSEKFEDFRKMKKIKKIERWFQNRFAFIKNDGYDSWEYQKWRDWKFLIILGCRGSPKLLLVRKLSLSEDVWFWYFNSTISSDIQKLYISTKTKNLDVLAVVCDLQNCIGLLRWSFRLCNCLYREWISASQEICSYKIERNRFWSTITHDCNL